MSFSKWLYEQEAKSLAKEVKKYDARAEEKPVKFSRCLHKYAKIIDGELKCVCGSAWRGPRIAELYQLFTKGKRGR